MVPKLKKNLTVKKLSVLLRRITSKHLSDFCCLNCLHSFATEKTCESRKTVYKKKDVCKVVMPFENTKTLEFNQLQKLDLLKHHLLFMQILNI